MFRDSRVQKWDNKDSEVVVKKRRNDDNLWLTAHDRGLEIWAAACQFCTQGTILGLYSVVYYVEQKNGVRGCYRAVSGWHTVFLHSTVHFWGRNCVRRTRWRGVNRALSRIKKKARLTRTSWPRKLHFWVCIALGKFYRSTAFLLSQAFSWRGSWVQLNSWTLNKIKSCTTSTRVACCMILKSSLDRRLRCPLNHHPNASLVHDEPTPFPNIDSHKRRETSVPCVYFFPNASYLVSQRPRPSPEWSKWCYGMLLMIFLISSSTS